MSIYLFTSLILFSFLSLLNAQQHGHPHPPTKIKPGPGVHDNFETVEVKPWLQIPHNLDERKHQKMTKTNNLHFHEEHLNSIIGRINSMSDGETFDAINNFFFGYENGTVIELGAVDGVIASQSLPFEKLGWLRILIEASPNTKPALRSKCKRSVVVNAAMCASESVVHYADKPLVGGVIEFMGTSYLDRFYKDILAESNPKGDVSKVNWSRYPYIVPVHCLPLREVLDTVDIHHVNFFILDVEGGEHQILQTIDWDKTTFDVVCIETDTKNRPDGYPELIAKFMTERGYRLVGIHGRNSWFISNKFEPSYKYREGKAFMGADAIDCVRAKHPLQFCHAQILKHEGSH